MPSVSVAYFQGIMIAPCHVPVQSSQDALIIIHQRLPSQLHEPRVIQMECGPSLVQYKTSVFVNQRILPPHTDMLCRELQRQLLAFISQSQSGTFIDKPRRFITLTAGRQRAIPVFSSCTNLG